MDIIRVSYDTDYKWIVEAMNDGEMEFATGNVITDAYLNMKTAVMWAFDVAKNRKACVVLYNRIGKHVFTKTWEGKKLA